MINISGIVIPVNWDAYGNVVELAIATRKEEEYFIEHDDKATKLKSFLRQEVEISGVLKNKGERKIIKIKSLRKKEIDLA
jgi:hypothetical protein